jgi:hypothetical protein
MKKRSVAGRIRPTDPIKVRTLLLGGCFPVRIKTMWKEPLGRAGAPLIVGGSC